MKKFEEKILLQDDLAKENVYNFSAALPGNKTVDLSDYKDKVILIVNTASMCGLTPQFEGLEKLYEKYREQGLIILGFPCDQFASQEFQEDEKIQNFCKLNYGVTFPVFSRIDVNGSKTHPLFKYLKDKLPGFLGTKQIKWNFTKFLIDRNGKPVKRIAPNVIPAEFESDIKGLL
jgi:glutathione peroxidase